MKKTLVVSYSPREESNTQKLLDAFFQACHSQKEIEHCDLTLNPPPLLLSNNLNVLLKRNFMEMDLSPEENKYILQNDFFMKQVLAADRIVIAFPMYNFSLPATVKAWVDSVVQKDRTFKINDEGNYEGLCHNKKALILMTTGADYREEPYQSMNFASPLMEACFGFMGIESFTIAAYGMNKYPDKVDDILRQSQQNISKFLESDESW